jgi:hypothetical protein
LLTRSNRRNLPQATWDRLVRLLLGRELDRLGAFLRPLSVHVKSPDASTTQHFGGTPHLSKKEGSNLDAIFIVGQHYAVADHLFPPAYMHMIALYTVWYNYVKQHKSLMGLSPAMAADISATLWSMTDLAEMIDASLPKAGPRGPYKRVA